MTGRKAKDLAKSMATPIIYSSGFMDDSKAGLKLALLSTVQVEKIILVVQL
jgi:hypothetical protein